MRTVISRHNSTSSVQSVTSVEVAEITETARNAEAQIAELASHSTDDGAEQHSSLPPNNHSTRHRDDDEDAGGSVSTPDGNVQPVATFITIPRGQSVSQLIVTNLASISLRLLVTLHCMCLDTVYNLSCHLFLYQLFVYISGTMLLLLHIIIVIWVLYCK